LRRYRERERRKKIIPDSIALHHTKNASRCRESSAPLVNVIRNRKTPKIQSRFITEMLHCQESSAFVNFFIYN